MRKPLALLAWAARIMVAKRTVDRQEPPFAIDLGAYDQSIFEERIPFLRTVERQLRQVPADRRGMRWIHRPDEVLFYGECRFDVRFEDFVAKVNIGHVGQFYRDCVGVTTVVAGLDEAGRTRHQGVRVIALPQPNYAAFLGKEELDVYKLESIDYSPDEHRVWMYTVHSPNGSAVCDDGYISFARTADGTGTVVSFLACQNFPVPPLMRLFRLDRWTWFRTVVTESAYRRFCNIMMRNLGDCYHRREFRIGRPARQPAVADA